MKYQREFVFPVDRLLPESPYQAMKELLSKSKPKEVKDGNDHIPWSVRALRGLSTRG